MKYTRLDAEYKARRTKVAESLSIPNLWEIIDHWPLYVGVMNLHRFLTISDLLRETAALPGHVIEAGVWRGANLLFMAKLLQIWDPYGSKIVHGFDDFVGYTKEKFSPSLDGEAVGLEGSYTGDLEALQRLMRLYDLDGPVELHIGLIEETLPQFFQDNPSLDISFVYLDTDLYTSTATVLEEVHPRLVDGGIIVLDEHNFSNRPGESAAVREFLKNTGRDGYRAQYLRTRQPTLYLKRIG